MKLHFPLVIYNLTPSFPGPLKQQKKKKAHKWGIFRICTHRGITVKVVW